MGQGLPDQFIVIFLTRRPWFFSSFFAKFVQCTINPIFQFLSLSRLRLLIYYCESHPRIALFYFSVQRRSLDQNCCSPLISQCVRVFPNESIILRFEVSGTLVQILFFLFEYPFHYSLFNALKYTKTFFSFNCYIVKKQHRSFILPFYPGKDINILRWKNVTIET